MKIRGVVLQTIDEQRAGGDPQPLDPDLIETAEDVPVWLNYDWRAAIGRSRVYVEDGRLLFEATIRDVLYAVTSLPPLAAYDGLDTKCFGISLVDRNRNAHQPPWEYVRST